MILVKIKDAVRWIRVCIIRLCAINKPLIDLSGEKILIVAPHPDDEIIGCAGLMSRFAKSGNVYLAVLSGGENSHATHCNMDKSALMNARRNLTIEAAETIELPKENICFFNYPDGKISYDCEETQRLKSLIEELGPVSIFVPHLGEGWSDHINTNKIVNEITKKNTAIHIYEYCVWFWYYNVWDIVWRQACILKMSNGEHESKLAAMDAYIKPLAPCGKPWSGVLPKVFVEANKWNRELYFKVR